MKASFGSRHGPSLGPGQYNPQYPRAIEIKDEARPSSSFKSGSRRMHVHRPKYNLGPGQHDTDRFHAAIRIRDPKRALSSFKDKRARFRVDQPYPERKSDEFSVADRDGATWERCQAYLSTTPRPPPSTMHAVGCAPDQMYDWFQANDIQKRVERMPRNVSLGLSAKLKRFPDVVVENKEHEPARPLGPGSFEINRDFIRDKRDQHKMSSSFKSTTRRSGHKRLPVVDFWGWHGSGRKGKTLAGGSFSTLPRWTLARPLTEGGFR